MTSAATVAAARYRRIIRETSPRKLARQRYLISKQQTAPLGGGAAPPNIVQRGADPSANLQPDTTSKAPPGYPLGISEWMRVEGGQENEMGGRDAARLLINAN